MNDEDLAKIYKHANGEDVGKAQPITTARVFKAMRAALAAQPGSVAADCDVRTIMLDVVPGWDGEGVEVYAKSVAEVEAKLGEIWTELEEWQMGIRRLPAAPTEAKPAQPASEPVAMVLPYEASVRLQWASVEAAHNAEPGPLYAAMPATDPLQPAANWLLSNVEHCDAGELAHRLVISPEYAIRLERAAISAKKGQP